MKKIVIESFLLAVVNISGLLTIVSSAALGVFCVLSVIQIAMISSREKVVMPYNTLVIFKMILALIACEYKPFIFCFLFVSFVKIFI